MADAVGIKGREKLEKEGVEWQLFCLTEEEKPWKQSEYLRCSSQTVLGKRSCRWSSKDWRCAEREIPPQEVEKGTRGSFINEEVLYLEKKETTRFVSAFVDRDFAKGMADESERGRRG